MYIFIREDKKEAILSNDNEFQIIFQQYLFLV